jgi:hypothetical protein
VWSGSKIGVWARVETGPIVGKPGIPHGKLQRTGSLFQPTGSALFSIGARRFGDYSRAEFFESDAIGLTYYLQKWFQYYLQQWIESRMGELEAKEGIVSLDSRWRLGKPAGPNQGAYDPDRDMDRIPSIEGEFADRYGSRWAADVSMIRKTLDLSTMTLDWVKDTNDPLFIDLEPGERLLLYLHFGHRHARSGPSTKILNLRHHSRQS